MQASRSQMFAFGKSGTKEQSRTRSAFRENCQVLAMSAAISDRAASRGVPQEMSQMFPRQLWQLIAERHRPASRSTAARGTNVAASSRRCLRIAEALAPGLQFFEQFRPKAGYQALGRVDAVRCQSGVSR
jgi:hypothetical protein